MQRTDFGNFDKGLRDAWEEAMRRKMYKRLLAKYRLTCDCMDLEVCDCDSSPEQHDR